MATGLERRIGDMLKPLGANLFRVGWGRVLEQRYGAAGDAVYDAAEDIFNRQARLDDMVRERMDEEANQRREIEAAVERLEELIAHATARLATVAERRARALTIEQEAWLRGALASPAREPRVRRATSASGGKATTTDGGKA